MRHYLNEDQRRRVADQYQSGIPFMRVARINEIGTTTLARILREFSIPSRKGKCKDKEDSRRSLTILQEQFAIDEYRKGRTSQNIAEELGCSFSTVLETLRRNNIRPRHSGITYVTEEFRKNQSRAQQIRVQDPEYRNTLIERIKRVGFKWDGGKKDKTYMGSSFYRSWRKMVIAKRGQCYLCASKHRLHIHHIVPTWEEPDLIFVEDNIAVLCCSCHMHVEAIRRRGGDVDLTKVA